MDIHGWLQGVTSEEQTVGLDKLDIPDFLIPKDKRANPFVQPSRVNHANASSILEPAKLSNPSKGIKEHVVKDKISVLSSQGLRSSDKDSVAVQEKYSKQPRRKTRPEIYDSKRATTLPKSAKVSDKKRKKPKDVETKKKKRRLEVPDTREFVAENVCANRLTVRSVQNLGSTADIKASAIE